MKPRRTDRLASEIVREISDIIIRKIADPRLQWVTITRAAVTADLREAKVYIRILSQEETQRQQTLKAIQHAAGFIRTELGHRFHWRMIPEIKFYFDEELEKTERVQQLLSQLKLDRGSKPDGTETQTS